MMLVTLVENAIKHGLNPLPEGVRSNRRASGRRLLRLEVVDTGRGFQDASGGGIGLANIRARLAALYGGRARLTLLGESAARRGVDPQPAGGRSAQGRRRDPAVPAVAVVDEPSPGAGLAAFRAGCCARSRPRLLPMALTRSARGKCLAGPFTPADAVRPTCRHCQAALLTDLAIITGILLAVLIADEAVARAARRWTTYFGAVVAGCAFAAWAQWQLLWVIWPDDARSGEIAQMLPGLLHQRCCTAPFGVLGSTSLSARPGWPPNACVPPSWRAEVTAAHARIAPAGDAGPHRAAVPVQHAGGGPGAARPRPAVAGRLLDDLIVYLRAALPHLRESTSTVAQEIELAQAWLNILRLRLGERLAFEIDVPEAANSASMPPMILLPLVDYALVNGPQPGDAGSIAIAAHAEGDRLRLTLTDSGTPSGPVTKAVATKSTVAERLHTLYGEDAALRARADGRSPTPPHPGDSAMNAPTAVIAEDEPLLRAELREMLAAQWPELEVVAEADDGIAAMRALAGARSPQILFLDIEMPGMTGLEVAAPGERQVPRRVRHRLRQVRRRRVRAGRGRLRDEAVLTAPRSTTVRPPEGAPAVAARRPRRRCSPRWRSATPRRRTTCAGSRPRRGQSMRLITVDEICYFQADTSTRWW